MRSLYVTGRRQPSYIVRWSDNPAVRIILVVFLAQWSDLKAPTEVWHTITLIIHSNG